MEQNNNAKPRRSKSKRKSTDCKLCNENGVSKSRNIQQDVEISTGKNHEIHHYRQTSLSEYFSNQEVNNLRDAESQKPPVMVNFQKLINQLLNAKVVVERYSQAAKKPKLCQTLQIKMDRLQVDSKQPKSEFLENPKLQVEIERLQLDSQQPKSVEESESLQNCNKNDSQNKLIQVRRFCHKCKTSYIDETNVSIEKKCLKCGLDLFYVCLQCNTNFYLKYRSLVRHRKSCKAQKKSDIQSLESVQLIYCMDCEFFTVYESGMKIHVLRTKHRVLKRFKE